MDYPSGLINLPVERLHPHPDNPRKDLGDLTELSASIKENGIFQNLTVVVDDPASENSTFTVIIGHRRLEAAKLAGLTEVPCVVVEMTPKEQLQTMLLENMQRSDLTVYEQAQGFQMMLDLGATVEEISEKSGFSKKTVQRRLEMAKLDKKTLQKVSSRQLSLADFDKLAEIEDMKLRNKVLNDIGTQNFNQALADAKREEDRKKNLPILEKWLKAHGAKKIDESDTYGSRYISRIGKSTYNYIWIDSFSAQKNLPSDKDVEGLDLFYVIRGNYFSLYIKNPDIGSGRGKQTEEEKARNRTMREVRAKIKEFSLLHHGLRKAFIYNLTVTKQNKDKIIAGALAPAIYFASAGGSNRSKTISEVTGIREFEYKTDAILAALDALAEKDLAKVVYAVYDDGPENWFSNNMEAPATIPGYDSRSCNIRLQLLYRWLISLGYEPSDDERALMDGSHEIYRKAKKK